MPEKYHNQSSLARTKCHSIVRVSIIGHSAGAAFVEAAAKAIKATSPSTVVHTTFLDPYLSLFLVGTSVYGANADWSDCYFVQDRTGVFTSGNLANAFNVDVSWVDTNHKRTPVPCPSSTAESTPPALSSVCGYEALSSHDYPIDFYSNSIVGALPACGAGYGFPLSKEGGGWNNRGNYSPNPNASLVLCGEASSGQGSVPTTIGPELKIGLLPNATSSFGVTALGDSAFNLSTTSLLPPPHVSGGPGRVRPRSGGSSASSNAPAWLAVGVTITNAANFIQFDAAFDDTNSAQGLMTLYWNANQIGMLDERVSAPGFETIRFALPSAVTNGFYTLSFHLDAFTNAIASVTITNVVTGFVGLTEPFSLGASLNKHGAPILLLSGTPGYKYLLQSSENLVDWVPEALLLNTNATTFFTEPTTNNPSQRFFRALLSL